MDQNLVHKIIYEVTRLSFNMAIKYCNRLCELDAILRGECGVWVVQNKTYVSLLGLRSWFLHLSSFLSITFISAFDGSEARNTSSSISETSEATNYIYSESRMPVSVNIKQMSLDMTHQKHTYTLHMCTYMYIYFPRFRSYGTTIIFLWNFITEFESSLLLWINLISAEYPPCL